MALESGKVATGDTIQAADFNKLRNDLLANHTHTSGEGGTVDHADLTETGDMSGMGHRHEDIESHLLGGGAGPNAIDNPGGSQGIHGLASTVYAAGAQGRKFDASWTASQLVIQGGYVTWSPTADYGTKSVTFGDSGFDTLASVVVTPYYPGVADTHSPVLAITAASSTGFSVKSVSYTPTGFYWIAIGTKA